MKIKNTLLLTLLITFSCHRLRDDDIYSEYRCNFPKCFECALASGNIDDLKNLISKTIGDVSNLDPSLAPSVSINENVFLHKGQSFLDQCSEDKKLNEKLGNNNLNLAWFLHFNFLDFSSNSDFNTVDDFVDDFSSKRSFFGQLIAGNESGSVILSPYVFSCEDNTTFNDLIKNCGCDVQKWFDAVYLACNYAWKNTGLFVSIKDKGGKLLGYGFCLLNEKDTFRYKNITLHAVPGINWGVYFVDGISNEEKKESLRAFSSVSLRGFDIFKTLHSADENKQLHVIRFICNDKSIYSHVCDFYSENLDKIRATLKDNDINSEKIGPFEDLALYPIHGIERFYQKDSLFFSTINSEKI